MNTARSVLTRRLALNSPRALEIGRSLWAQKVMIIIGASSGILVCALIAFAAQQNLGMNVIDLWISILLSLVYIRFLVRFNQWGAARAYELMLSIVVASSTALEAYFLNAMLSQSASGYTGAFLLGPFSSIMPIFAYTYLLRSHARFLSAAVVLSSAGILLLSTWTNPRPGVPLVLNGVIMVLLPLQCALVMELGYRVQTRVLGQMRSRDRGLSQRAREAAEGEKIDTETGLLNLQGLLSVIDSLAGQSLSLAEICRPRGGLSGAGCQQLSEQLGGLLPHSCHFARSDDQSLLICAAAIDHAPFLKALEKVCGPEPGTRELRFAHLHEVEQPRLSTQFLLNDLSAQLLSFELTSGSSAQAFSQGDPRSDPANWGHQ